MSIQKFSATIAGHKTSFSLEPEFWGELKRFASKRKMTLGTLITEIDAARTGNLSSALRVYVLKELKKETGDMTETVRK